METTFIHPSAEIDKSAVIGEGSRIWQHCILVEGVVLGKGCKLGHNVFIEGGVRLGNMVTVKDNVALYTGLEVGDEVFIGPNAVFTNVLNPRSTISRKHEIKKTVILRGASIGANATILCGITIGRYAMIGAGATVTRNVPNHALAVGSPAEAVGWVSAAGCKLDDTMICPETGIQHELNEGGLVALEQ